VPAGLFMQERKASMLPMESLYEAELADTHLAAQRARGGHHPSSLADPVPSPAARTEPSAAAEPEPKPKKRPADDRPDGQCRMEID
jgi:hypothetical protein